MRTHIFRRIIATIAAVLAATLLIGNVPALAVDTNTATISGTVTAPAGVVLTSVYVNAQPSDPQSPSWGWASVASDGTYRMEGLAAGSYKLVFSGNNSGAETQWYNNAATQEAATAVTLAVGQNLTGINATLVKGASISGKVTVPAGVDMTNMQATASSPDSEYSQSSSVSVASDGSYRLAGLAAGSYKLKFSGYNSGAISQWYNNAGTFAAAETLVLAKGQDLSGINATLVKGASISGKVTAPAGIDMTNMRVAYYAADSQSNETGSTQVAADGTYRLSGLAAGSYKLKFDGYQSGALTQWYSNASSFSDASAVGITAGQDLTGINATLVKGATISGKVTAPAGINLRSVYVNVMPTEPQSGMSTSFVQLAADGTYRAAGLPAGAYKMEFSGFNSGALPQWYNNADSLAAANALTVTAGQDLTGIDATLVKGASISGKVTVPAGVDPARTYVNLYSADSQSLQSSGAQVFADGSYKVAGLKAGSYKLQFSAGNTGALPQWYNNAETFATATAVDVAAAQDLTGINATLAKGATISGTVSAPAGVTLTGVTVTAYSGDNIARYSASTQVGADGKYQLYGLPAGSYKLQFSGSNSGALAQWYNNSATIETAAAVTVTAGQDVGSINATLVKGASIRGKLTVPAGIDATQIYVSAYTAASQSGYVLSGAVAADGTYRLLGLEAGSYKIQFSAYNSGALSQWYTNAATFDAAAAVAVTAAQDVANINATLLKGATISGKVTAPAGISASSTSVTAYPAASGTAAAPAANTWVSADGSYKLVGLAAGSYKLQFSANSSGALTQWYSNAATEDAASPVAVTAGQDLTGVNALLAKGATISGKVTVPAGINLWNISVNADSADGKSIYMAFSGVATDGSYKLVGLPTGSYKVRFAGNSSGAVDQWYNNAATAATANALPLTAGQDLTGINATLVKGATISGKVAGLSVGEQHPVTVLDSAGTPVKEGYSDTTGSYSVTGLAAGTYKVAFNRSSGPSLAEAQFFQNKAESAGVGAASSVAVTTGQSITGKDGTLVKGGSLSGTVTDKLKAPLAAAMVQAYTKDGSLVTRMGFTDAQGKFSVTGLTTGKYLLVVTPPYGKAELGKLYSGSVTTETAAVPVSATVGSDKPAGELTYGTATPVPVTDPKATVTLDPAKPAEAAVSLNNSASTVSVDYHVIVNGDLTRPKVTVAAGQKSDVVLTALAAKSTVQVRIYGDGKGTGTLLASATTPDAPVAPVTDPKATVTLDPAKPAEAAVSLNNSASTVSVDYHVIVNGDLTRPKVTVAAGQKSDVVLTALAAKSTVQVRIYGDGKGTGTLLASATTPDATVAPAPSFTDVSTGNQFYKEITWLASSGISTGWTAADGTKTFGPVLPVNRDAMAAFMYRFRGKPAFTPPAVSPFTDVATSNQFYKEITWLASTGITTGWTAGDGSRTYAPVQAVNRDAMAAFMYRLAGKPAFTPPAVSPFTDVATSNQFYKEITWLASTGITTGWTAGDGSRTYAPVQAVNRDAMAAFMYRYNAKFGTN
ncbi:carboxypeptidase regulatory-like domain-containing protein [Arthrobacter sp. FB24]|uniref:carboxypeptidase regulatory-like domain-containing protein n=1 Tax=Arthrobacter sp. (strain FB24) TaxID=290399 RepID=UPI0018DDDCC5|nr:carboxypeptidase regulatory-like domain-containing protein [Arthrobacter sp. FB24]